jgi:ketosteroid isomerase-like protein
MRYYGALAASICLSALVACQPAEQAAPVFSAEEQAAVEAEVEQTIDAYNEAVRRMDLDGMFALWAQEEGAALAADGKLIAGFDAYADYVRQMLGDVTEIVELEDWNPHTYVLGPDAASHAVEWRWALAGAAGDTVRSQGSWLYVLKRFDDGWKIVHSAGTHLYD